MIEVDLIEYENGEAGVIADRKLQVFCLYDNDGNALLTWNEEDREDGPDNPRMVALAKMPYKLVRRPSSSGFYLEELELVAKIGRQLRDSTGEYVGCFMNNIDRIK